MYAQIICCGPFSLHRQPQFNFRNIFDQFFRNTDTKNTNTNINTNTNTNYLAAAPFLLPIAIQFQTNFGQILYQNNFFKNDHVMHLSIPYEKVFKHGHVIFIYDKIKLK